ncbi:MAG: flagella basal body P-ring formation protein FlgA [Planctomycetota bacterium]|nr:MAG: flagella basal body P-ring formation protein FlgA [Planctomycetota bacterium]
MIMSNRTIGIIVTVFLLTSATSRADDIEKSFPLRIHLPRDVSIEGDTLQLGQVSIIRGEETLVAKANKISIGRFSVPGQEIVINRSTVLSRLACSGIPVSKVSLTGAEKVTVKQRQQIIKGEEFVELAKSFLDKNPLVDSVCKSTPVTLPKDLILQGSSEDIKLSARLIKSGARNRAKVRIAVLANGIEIGAREVTFRLKYNSRRVTTLVDIPAGAVISPENVRIEKALSDYPEPSDWSPPYGLIAKRRLPANTVILPNMTTSAKAPIIVERNQTVVIRFENPELLVTAIGKTMQKGRAGEYIKVRNVDSHRIIVAKVNENGTVEPVF